MTFDERVTFYMSVLGMSRDDALRQAALDTGAPDLDPASTIEVDALAALYEQQ